MTDGTALRAERLRVFKWWAAERWEVAALVLLAAALYQPWSAAALPTLDFSEFLPQLAAYESPTTQFAAIVRYMESQGRFCPLLYAHIVLAWNAFGMWAPGWHWTYFAVLAAVLVTGYKLMIDVGLRRPAAFAAVAVWLIAPPVAEGSVRLTGEMTGLLFLITALRVAHNYPDAPDWRRRAVVIAGCVVGAIASKEMLAVLIPVVWLMTRLSHREGKWAWASLQRRDLVVATGSGAAAIIALLPVALVALSAPAGSYAARYGTVNVGVEAVVHRLEAALLPSRAGLPGATQLANDPGWQMWLTLPNLLWLSLFAAGLAAAMRPSRDGRSMRWPILIAALWALSGVTAYLPWPSRATFYMLPFAFGAAFGTAHILHMLFESRTFRGAAAAMVTAIVAIGAVEARDMVHEHELRVNTDVSVIAAIADRGRALPLVAAVPDPMPPGGYGWGLKLGEYGRAAGEIAPLYARDVSCADGRRLLEYDVMVVSGSNGCGRLTPGSMMVSETVPRRRWPWLFDGRSNRRVAFVARGGEKLLSAEPP